MKTPTASLRILAATALLCALCGCKPDAAVRKGESLESANSAHPGAPPAAPVNPAQAGNITGAAQLKGTPPARIAIDMSMDPACSLAGENLTEQYIVNKGGLANVFVYIKSGLPEASAPAAAQPVRIDQHGCRFVPHVAAVEQGGSVEFTNSDPTMHNVHIMPTAVGNASVDVSQGPGAQPQVRQFNKPEVMLPVRCNNHPWMNALLNVAPNQYFAVTAADGTFTLKGLPPGTYTLAAVHEKLGEQDLQVTVPAHGTATAAFSFTMH